MKTNLGCRDLIAPCVRQETKITSIMKKTYYFVKVYFTDTDGRFRSHTIQSHSIDSARDWKELYESHIGKMFYSAHWEGVIDSVFVFKGNLCNI